MKTKTSSIYCIINRWNTKHIDQNNKTAFDYMYM